MTPTTPIEKTIDRIRREQFAGVDPSGLYIAVNRAGMDLLSGKEGKDVPAVLGIPVRRCEPDDPSGNGEGDAVVSVRWREAAN